MDGHATSVRRKAGVLAAVLALAVSVLVAVLLSHASPTSGTPSALHPAPLVTVPSEPPAAPVAAKKTLPHDRVDAAAPTQFVLTGPAFRVTANVCGMPAVFPLDPPGDQLHTVCWVDHDFGVAPGSGTRGTTYVLGHAWSQQQLVLNPLSEFATAHLHGARYASNHVATYSVPALLKYSVTLTTPNGTLGYTVTSAFLVGKLDARGVASLMATSTPNRVVVITCAVRDGIDLPQNVILYAKLAWSKAKH
ncbi:MAG: hypothetical protein QOG80_2093 [Pseudonocardiales bacterium]|nr:hypothetical protein [Pseudonocardiales bacterium]